MSLNYSEIHTKRDKKPKSGDDRKLLTEKECYTTFLENQLEKMSSGLLMVDVFSQNIEDLKAKYEELEEKFGHSSKLTKLLQSFTEGQVDYSVNLILFQIGAR